MSATPDVLRIAALTADAASVAPGSAGAVAKIVASALHLAEGFARTGRDPLAEIERIKAADPLLQAVEGDWQQAMKDKFGSA